MELRFTTSKKELLKTLKIIKNGLPRGKHGALINLELKIGLNIITLLLPGLSHEVYGKTSGIGKAYVPLLHFESMVKDTTLEDVSVIIASGKVIVGKFTSTSNRITTHNSENLATIQLAVNHTQMELLALRYQYSFEELLANNYDALIMVAEDKLEQNITKAFELLKQYEVTSEMINELIKARIITHKNKI